MLILLIIIHTLVARSTNAQAPHQLRFRPLDSPVQVLHSGANETALPLAFDVLSPLPTNTTHLRFSLNGGGSHFDWQVLPGVDHSFTVHLGAPGTYSVDTPAVMLPHNIELTVRAPSRAH